MNRRHFIHCVNQVFAFGVCCSASAADMERPSQSEQEAMRFGIEGFLREHRIQGISIAYGREGSLAFEQAYGFADADKKEAMTPEHRFRIASIAKPITATAVMMCFEKNQLSLDDKVFGPQGILGEDYGRNLPESVLAITVDHFLTHTSGGWPNDKDDPMFKHPKMNHNELILWTLNNQKQMHPAGTRYAYSNFGYCVLGRVLEKLENQPYQMLIAQHLLSKCGITTMKIGGNTLEDRQSREVVYLTEIQGEAYEMNVKRMDSHGGWISTAADVVRFASQLPKLLNAKSISTMTTAGKSEGYARGWCINKARHWWHSGGMPGTSTIMVHTANGISWAGLLNGHTQASVGALDKLMWDVGREVKAWRL